MVGASDCQYTKSWMGTPAQQPVLVYCALPRATKTCLVLNTSWSGADPIAQWAQIQREEWLRAGSVMSCHGGHWGQEGGQSVWHVVTAAIAFCLAHTSSKHAVSILLLCRQRAVPVCASCMDWQAYSVWHACPAFSLRFACCTRVLQLLCCTMKRAHSCGCKPMVCVP